MNDAGKILNPFEHALLRPDKYIGSKITTKKKEWVFDDETKSMIYREIIYNPGLVHLVIEVLSNALDNTFRSLISNVKMTKIQFSIDFDHESETFGWITVLNDGYPILAKSNVYTLENGAKEEMYPVQAFFTKMLAGTNFENDKTRKTSGRNGIGAKTMVIFSEQCIIEHTDPNNRKKVILEISENGKNKGKPKVTSFSGVNGYTKVAFLPDYSYFDFNIEDSDTQADFLGILKRLVYDCAMITKLNVSFNDKKLKVDSLLKYAKLYYPDAKLQTISSGKVGDLINSECVVCEKTVETDVEGLEKFSWINGIFTAQGGIHVDAYTQKIMVSVVKKFNEKNSTGKNPLKTTSAHLSPYLAIFVRAEAPGPNWEGNNKEKLFGIYDSSVDKTTDKYPVKLDKEELESLVDKVYKWEFISDLKNNLLDKKDSSFDKKSKTGNKRVKYEKLRDANHAGNANSKDCVLFITEGDSAKGFADALAQDLPGGLNKYGSMAIKGKMLNTIKCTKSQLEANAEVKAFRESLGLNYGVDYSKLENRKTLRYGTVLIMSDQDDDGFHIRGLIIAFLNHFWPSLLLSDPLKLGKPFIQSFTTAVVMIHNDGKKDSMPLKFYSNPEFKEYMKTHPNIGSNRIKYYKGLGTHTPEKDTQYYVNDVKVLEYKADENAKKTLTIWFSDDKEAGIQRKKEMLKRLPKPEGDCAADEDSEISEISDNGGDYIDEDKFQAFGTINITDFCNNQLMIYNLMTMWRAIPNVWDGNKESQRKVLDGTPYTKKTIGVDKLVGKIGEKTSYHHGAVSLEKTVIGMAQKFPGSNNIPLLIDDGNFGSRAKKSDGGDDAAAARYISSGLRPLTKVIFPQEDLPILDKNIEEGKMIGYKYYMPIIPMILVNGAEGIGTGWSTKIPSYNPLDLVEWIEKWLDLDDREEETPDMEALKPWYRGYKGKVVLSQPDENMWYKSWLSYGTIKKGEPPAGVKSNESATDVWYDITELPIGLWTNVFKNYLDEISDPSAKNKKGESIQVIKKYTIESMKNTNIHFKILPLPGVIPNVEDPKNFAAVLKVQKSLNNMIVTNEFGYPIKYSCVEHLLDDFCKKRLGFYGKRKTYQLQKYIYEKEKSKNKYRFIQEVIDSKFVINNYKTEEALEEALEKAGYKKFTNTFVREEEKDEIILEDDDETEGEEIKVEKKGGKTPSYNYLLNISVRTQTQSSVNKLKNESAEAEKEYNILNTKSPETIWKEDLEKFKVEYDKFLKDIETTDNIDLTKSQAAKTTKKSKK